VYQGGIGSYALFVMVAAFLLLHPSRHPSRPGSKRAGIVALTFQQSPSSCFDGAPKQGQLLQNPVK